MKRAGTAIGATLIALAFSATTAGVAHADPYNCSSKPNGTNSWGVRCTDGTGKYQAVVDCEDSAGQYNQYGPVVGVGELSVARCGVGGVMKGGSFRIVEH